MEKSILEMKEKKISSCRGNVYYWISRHPEKNKEAIVFLPNILYWYGTLLYTGNQDLIQDFHIPTLQKN